MNKNYLILGAVVIGILGLFWWLNQQSRDRFNWSETYDEKSREPYGTSIAHDILRGYLPNKKFENLTKAVAKSLPTDSAAATANYIFVGDGYLADTADVDKLVLFVYNGGRAFVSANAVPNYLLHRLALTTCRDTVTKSPNPDGNPEKDRKDLPDPDGNTDENPFQNNTDDGFHRFNYSYTDSAALNFQHPQLVENQPIELRFRYKNKTWTHDWAYLDTLRTAFNCTDGGSNVAPIGTLNGEFVNFAKINYGRGALFLHTTPLAFTNVELLDSTHLRYAAKAFSHLQNGTIFFDTKSRTSRDVVSRMNGSNLKLSRDSPLKFVLAQPSLRWAWFLFLGLVGMYFLFMAKRRQRIIPVLAEKTNTSLQFIQTIGLMYFRGAEHLRVCDMKLKQFQTFVRERYKLTSHDMNDEFIATLALKSDVADADIRKIARFEKRIVVGDITEDAMIDLHHLLNRFYKNCK